MFISASHDGSVLGHSVKNSGTSRSEIANGQVSRKLLRSASWLRGKDRQGRTAKEGDTFVFIHTYVSAKQTGQGDKNKLDFLPLASS